MSVPCVSVAPKRDGHKPAAAGGKTKRGNTVVTRDTRWPAGTPCWVDVSVDDVPKAIAFYKALFGWDIELGADEVGGYSIAHSGGHIVAAISPKMAGPDAPTVWTTFLASDDVDATADKIKGAGGQVLAGPMDVME